jgi:hypothetical protein
MGSSFVKDEVDLTRTRVPFVWDPIGPVKLEAIDFILRNFTEQFTKRLNTIETHLEQGIGQGASFIRFQERPDVGGAALQDLPESLRKLHERLDRLESYSK